MAGHRKDKTLCGAAYDRGVCRKCGTGNAKTDTHCIRCGAEMWDFCRRHVAPGDRCPDHPDAAVHPECPTDPIEAVRLRMSPSARAVYDRVRSMTLAEKTQALADMLTTESLTSGDPARAEAASRTLVNAMRVKSEE